MRHIQAEFSLAVEKGTSVSVAFSFFLYFREMLAVPRFEVLQERVLEPRGESGM